MRYFISHDEKLCLFWTPKCGCSTATEIFFKYIGYDYSKYGWIHDARQIYQKTQPKKIPPESIKLQIVRNPYNKAISGFFHFILHGLIQENPSLIGKRSETHEKFKEKILEWLKIKLIFNDNEETNKLTTNFFNCYKYVEFMDITEKKLDKNTFNFFKAHVHERQYLTNDLNFIIKLENLESDLNLFNRKFNFSLKKSRYDKHSFKKILGEELYKSIYLQIYSLKQNKEIIQKLYKKDFEYFNYPI
jgi:hypothetical protein